MEGHDTDEAGAPVIMRVSAKIAALERRVEYLDDHAIGTLTDARANFARAERKAIKGGIAALQYHRAEVEGLDTAWLVLQELVDALDTQPVRDATQRSLDAYRRAKDLLAERRS